VTRERLTGQGFVLTYLNPQQMGEMLKRDLLFWQKTIKAMNFKVEK
jgi:tripartite-type tricarboxylate transporter receptor subunit TctC